MIASPLLQEFIRNQRKVNNGQDFPREFLSGVYSKIKWAILSCDEHQ